MAEHWTESDMRAALDGHFYTFINAPTSGEVRVADIGRPRAWRTGLDLSEELRNQYSEGARRGALLRRERRYGKDVDQRILALLDQGLSRNAVAARIGCSTTMVDGVIERFL